MSSRSLVTAVAAILVALVCAPGAQAQTATVPGAARVSSTIYSISVEWDLVGDTNHDAAAAVEYRALGEVNWATAMPLVRVDYNGANMLAGSVLFLAPGTPYELRLTLTDPDGGAEVRLLSASTRPMPEPPTGGRIFEVVPGSGGGDGSAAAPFRGVAAAQAIARPGDSFLLHRGAYGGRIRFDTAGAEGNYIVWRGAGDGEVSIDGIDIAASHTWFEGLTVRNQAYATFSVSAPDDVVIRRCSFFNNHYSVYLQQGGANWYIADNTIVGDTPYTTESFDGEGIELNHTSGHTVAYNSITNVADGISYPLSNVDIVGNDIFDTSDDGIEGDYGYANVRIWGNRVHNAVHNGISFQPQNGAPWYIIRNQIVSNMEGAFKFRTTDRFLLLHNTIVNWGTAWPGDAMMCCNEDHLMRAFARNNLWISVQGGQIWGFDAFTRDWRTDLDYDGFDWGAASNPFSYGGLIYPDLGAFHGASGLEANGVTISKGTCFETFDVPNPPKNPVPAQTMTLTASCPAVDAGAVIPGVNEGRFEGLAPDLGAYERGQTPPSYGPRGVPTAVFSASPSTIAPGGSSVLSWTTTDATDVTLDQGIGRVAAGGSQPVMPPSTTTYTLTAIGPGGTSMSRVTITVVAPPAPLEAPSGLTATAVGPKQANLSWVDNSAGETGFTIERSTSGSPFSQIASVSAGVTTYSDRKVTGGKTYTYRVRAYGAAGTSPYSNTATVLTPRH